MGGGPQSLGGYCTIQVFLVCALALWACTAKGRALVTRAVVFSLLGKTNGTWTLMDWHGMGKGGNPNLPLPSQYRRIDQTTAQLRWLLACFISLLGGGCPRIFSEGSWRQPGPAPVAMPGECALRSPLASRNCPTQRGSRWRFFCLFPPGFQYMNKESYLKTTTTTVPAPPNPHLRGIVSPQDR